MSNTQLRDNICYLVAVQKFTALLSSQSITAEEFTLVKKELERRLRPTVAILT